MSDESFFLKRKVITGWMKMFATEAGDFCTPLKVIMDIIGLNYQERNLLCFPPVLLSVTSSDSAVIKSITRGGNIIVLGLEWL